jgi:hypothetical protein
MRLFFKVLLSRFKNWRYSLVYSPPMLALLFRLFMWVLQNLSETVIFGGISIWKTGENGMSLTNVLFIIVPIIWIIGLLTWTFLRVKKEFVTEYLPNTLTKMNERVLRLIPNKVKENKKTDWMLDAIPVLFHKLKVVDIGDWDTYENSLKKRIKNAISKIHDARKRWFATASISSQIKDEWIGAREWVKEDTITVGKWLDSYDMGVSSIIESDKYWRKLDKSLDPYRTDSSLRKLIKEFNDYSYCYCSTILVQDYGKQYKNNSAKHEDKLKQLLTVTLTEKLDTESTKIEMNEILDNITKRVHIFSNKKQKTHKAGDKK